MGGENFLINDPYDQDDVQMMSVMLIAEGAKGKIQIQRTAESKLPHLQELMTTWKLY